MERPSSTRQQHAAGARPGSHGLRLVIEPLAQKPALEAIARSRDLPLSAVVRTALDEWLSWRGAGGEAPAKGASPEATDAPTAAGGFARVSLRLPVASAVELARAARASEMSQSLLVARLLGDLIPLLATANLKETRLVLLRSTATLAALCCDLQALERSLNQAGRADLAVCTAVTSQLAAELRQHLAQASSLLAALTPLRRSSPRHPDLP